ncbi:hypothetical protein BT69DRAFT_1319146 [Atractiella rhizophila]|nr:hypothetical protein BT69DRAFT_1319146 [Atractiella rhizophila]
MISPALLSVLHESRSLLVQLPILLSSPSPIPLLPSPTSYKPLPPRSTLHNFHQLLLACFSANPSISGTEAHARFVELLQIHFGVKRWLELGNGRWKSGFESRAVIGLILDLFEAVTTKLGEEEVEEERELIRWAEGLLEALKAIADLLSIQSGPKGKTSSKALPNLPVANIAAEAQTQGHRRRSSSLTSLAVHPSHASVSFPYATYGITPFPISPVRPAHPSLLSAPLTARFQPRIPSLIATFKFPSDHVFKDKQLVWAFSKPSKYPWLAAEVVMDDGRITAEMRGRKAFLPPMVMGEEGGEWVAVRWFDWFGPSKRTWDWVPRHNLLPLSSPPTALDAYLATEDAVREATGYVDVKLAKHYRHMLQSYKWAVHDKAYEMGALKSKKEKKKTKRIIPALSIKRGKGKREVVDEKAGAEKLGLDKGKRRLVEGPESEWERVVKQWEEMADGVGSIETAAVPRRALTRSNTL